MDFFYIWPRNAKAICVNAMIKYKDSIRLVTWIWIFKCAFIFHNWSGQKKVLNFVFHFTDQNVGKIFTFLKKVKIDPILLVIQNPLLRLQRHKLRFIQRHLFRTRQISKKDANLWYRFQNICTIGHSKSKIWTTILMVVPSEVHHKDLNLVLKVRWYLR